MFSLKDNPWLRFFRVPNLPTAPGDALAGAAFMMPAGDARLPHAFAAAVGVLLMYMFGLADNDLADAQADAVNAPERPIPRGEISTTAATVAMGVCLFAAYMLPDWIVGQFRPGEQMPSTWTASMVTLTICIFVYNRLKSAWLMGSCRGLSVLCGGMAAWVPDTSPYAHNLLPESIHLVVALIMLAMGWVPLLCFVPIACASGMEIASYLLLVLPVAGCCCTFLAWCAAVGPLWLPHGPPERRRAVGKTIGALIYLQIGFMLIAPRPAFLAAAAGLWLASRLVRRLVPHISGS